MQIERVYKEDTQLSFADFLYMIVEEQIDSLLKDYYHQNQVITATSCDEGKDAA